MPGVKRGLDLKLYYNTGSFASPVWALSDARDVNVNATNGEGDSSSRQSEIKTTEPTGTSVSIEWEMLYDWGNAALLVFDTAMFAKTLKEFALADGLIAVSGTTYKRWECKLYDAGEGQPLDGVATRKFSAKPSNTGNAQGVKTLVP